MSDRGADDGSKPDAPERQATGADESSASFDVAVVVGPEGEGGGPRVLRLRPGAAEIGELRPLREGVPITGDVVGLTPRPGAPRGVFDVEVKHAAPPSKGRSPGPARVANASYRTGWDRIFATRRTGGDDDDVN